MKQNVEDMFNAAATEGKPMSGELPPSWPGNSPVEGMGVAGKVAEYDTFKGEDGSPVGVVRLTGAVVFVPGGGKGGAKLEAVGEVGVIIGAGLRRKVGDSVMPVGSFVSIRYTGVDPKLNNMRCYDVYETPRSYLVRLHEAAKIGAATDAGAKAPPSATDDLPF